MRRLTTFLFLLLPALSLSQPHSDPQPSSLALTHVTVIDMTGAPAKSDMTVVITGEAISEIGMSGKVTVPQNATVLDASGKFLIPGLWDMHVHWSFKEYLALFVVNGVTGIRIMQGMPFHYQWRKSIEAGTLLGPRMAISSPLVDGPNPIQPGSITVDGATTAKEVVDALYQSEADFIKVYSLVPRDAYFALAQEAKRKFIPFAGHVPASVAPAEASDAGQASIEHLGGIVFATSNRSDQLQGDRAQLQAEASQDSNYLLMLRRLEARHAQTHSEQKANALFARFAQNETWQCPTLTQLRGSAFLDDAGFTNDPRLKYMPPGIRAFWNPKNNPLYRSATSVDYTAQRQLLAKALEIVAAMHRAGVGILAGTDTPNPFSFAGFGIHDELALFVKAGLTPLQALQTATRDPARYLGRLDSLGTVEKGKLADLVLLDANPLADIDNSRKINSVIVNGRLLGKDDIAKRLAEVEAIAKAPLKN